MTTKEQVLADLNAAKDDLTARILRQSANPGTSEWKSMMQLVHQRDIIVAQINTVLLSAFDEATVGLSSAIADLEKNTAQLKNVQKTFESIGDVIQVADAIVHATTAIVGFAVKA